MTVWFNTVHDPTLTGTWPHQGSEQSSWGASVALCSQSVHECQALYVVTLNSTEWICVFGVGGVGGAWTGDCLSNLKMSQQRPFLGSDIPGLCDRGTSYESSVSKITFQRCSSGTLPSKINFDVLTSDSPWRHLQIVSAWEQTSIVIKSAVTQLYTDGRWPPPFLLPCSQRNLLKLWNKLFTIDCE